MEAEHHVHLHEHMNHDRKFRKTHLLEQTIGEHLHHMQVRNDDKGATAELLFIETELAEVQRTAHRAVKIVVVNQTKRKLKTHVNDLHGIWSLQPTETLQPQSTMIFGSQSSGILVGTGGKVAFTDGASRQVHISWNNPWRGKHTFERNFSNGFLVEFTTVTGNHSEIRAVIKINPGFKDNTDDDLLSYLKRTTYFCKSELRLLNDRFMQLSTSGAMTKDNFIQTFPELKNKTVVDSLFSAIADFSRQDETIDFEEWARVMSVMTRGKPEERAELSFNICDLNRNGYVERTEVLAIAEVLSEVMVGLGYDSETYGRPQEIVDNMFHKSARHHRGLHIKKPGVSGEVAAEVRSELRDEEEAEMEEGLTRIQFVKAASEDSDIEGCFGLYEFFNQVVVRPVEEKLGHTESPALYAWALKDKERVRVLAPLNWLLEKQEKRYFEIRDGMLAIYRKKGEPPRRVIALHSAAVRALPLGVVDIQTGIWSTKVYTSGRNDQQRWLSTIRGNMRAKNRFKSFAPERTDINCKFFPNGSEYYACLLAALNAAKSRIFIADWSLAPHLYLTRTSPLRKDDRLDMVLKRAAKRGVKIYILIWNASKLAFDIRPKFSANYLNLVHSNIYAMTHPFWTPFSWSHHQKFVVVDEEIAFVGGIDLTFNRYDDDRYLVTDEEGLVFPGRDYMNLGYHPESNGRGMDEVFDRHQLPRMPWHDVMMQLDQEAARDVSLNFVERWNWAMDSSPMLKRPKGLVYLVPRQTAEQESAEQKARVTAEELEKTSLLQRRNAEASYRRKIAIEEEDPEDERLSISEYKRALEQSEETGKTRPVIAPEPPSGKEEIHGSKEEIHEPKKSDENHLHKSNLNNHDETHLAPDGSLMASTGKKSSTIVQNQRHENHAKREGPPKCLEYMKGTKGELYEHCSVQILRQIGAWSGGVSTERSIYKSYLTAIRNSEHYIYIENQYFLSSIEMPSPKNRILDALYRRLRKAILNDENFRVIILLPVYPAGKLAEISTLYIIKYLFRSISRGGHSLLEKLQEDFPQADLGKYITFNSLRNHGLLGGRPISEQIYIHAKVLIVDDRVAIIGSANINDRSMRGTHDSEIAAYVETPKEYMIESTMGGQPYKVSKFARDLRMRLWSTYLGLPTCDPSLTDPTSDAVYKDVWQATCNHNTAIYSHVFEGLPENTKTIAEYSADPFAKPPREPEKLKELRGFLVDFPMNLLKDETAMNPTIAHKEFVLPKKIFM